MSVGPLRSEVGATPKKLPRCPRCGKLLIVCRFHKSITASCMDDQKCGYDRRYDVSDLLRLVITEHGGDP